MKLHDLITPEEIESELNSRTDFLDFQSYINDPDMKPFVDMIIRNIKQGLKEHLYDPEAVYTTGEEAACFAAGIGVTLRAIKNKLNMTVH